MRAAEEGGHPATAERATKDRKVRSDVLIRGANGVLLGFESQLSPVNPREIEARDTAARRAGLVDAWQTDSRAMAEALVVPWLRTNKLPFELIMRRDSPLPFRDGVRRIDLVRCDERFPGPCPRKGTGKCGRWHPTTRPAEVPFDPFIRDAASGLYVRATVKMKRTAYDSGPRRPTTPPTAMRAPPASATPSRSTGAAAPHPRASGRPSSTLAAYRPGLLLRAGLAQRGHRRGAPFAAPATPTIFERPCRGVLASCAAIPAPRREGTD